MILISFFSDKLRAQDTLYKSDGSCSVVNILEIKQNEVRYKFTSNPDGPVFVCNKNQISKIVRQNGEVISFQVYVDEYNAMNKMHTGLIKRIPRGSASG